MSNTEAEKAVIIAAMIANKHFTIDEAEAYLDAYTEQQVREAMAKFGLEKGVDYDIKKSDSVIVITKGDISK